MGPHAHLELAQAPRGKRTECGKVGEIQCEGRARKGSPKPYRGSKLLELRCGPQGREPEAA